jgi:hypothetical protein
VAGWSHGLKKTGLAALIDLKSNIKDVALNRSRGSAPGRGLVWRLEEGS